MPRLMGKAIVSKLEFSILSVDTFDMWTPGARNWTTNPPIGGQPLLSQAVAAQPHCGPTKAAHCSCGMKTGQWLIEGQMYKNAEEKKK